MVEDWTEKYRPGTLSDVVGNPKAVESMRLWARSWTEGEPEVKALILAGEPGVGKTSAALALARDFNWGMLELNASDARNKDTIEAVAYTGSVNETFTDSGEFRPKSQGGRKLIILDEADNLYERPAGGSGAGQTRERLVRRPSPSRQEPGEGLVADQRGPKDRGEDGDGAPGEGHGGPGAKGGERGGEWTVEKVKVQDVSDRGGKGAIIKTIRRTHQPIILIVNDLYALTKGSGAALKSLCRTIKFSRIPQSSIRKALVRICREENVSAHDDALDIIARNAGGDLRSAINDLQGASGNRKALTADDVSHLGFRDSKPGTFDAVAGVLTAVSFAGAREAMENIDESPDHFILWIDENLPIAYRDPADRDLGYLRLSRADIYLGWSRRTQVYRFWAYARDMMGAGVALAKRQGGGGHPGRLNFPQYLMKMSRSKGQRALRDTASSILAQHTHSSRVDVRTNYLHFYKYLLRAQTDLAVSLVRTTRMDAVTLAYLLDRKATSAEVKRLMNAALEGIPDREEVSIYLGKGELEKEDGGAGAAKKGGTGEKKDGKGKKKDGKGKKKDGKGKKKDGKGKKERGSEGENEKGENEKGENEKGENGDGVEGDDDGMGGGASSPAGPEDKGGQKSLFDY